MADLLQLGDIVDAVRLDMSDTSFSREVIVAKANDFQNDLFTSHRIRRMETNDTVSVSQGATTADIPSDFMTAIEIAVINGDGDFRFITDNYYDYKSFMRKFANFAQANPSTILHWTDFGNGFRFSAPVDADYTLSIDYLREPEQMVNDSDEAEVSVLYKEMFVKGTKARVQEREEDYAEGAQERQELDALITTFVRNEGRGGFKTGPTIMRTNRRRMRSE